MSNVLYVEDTFHRVESKESDCRPYGQNQDGYGRKIATRWMVRIDNKGPWRRVYCVIFSNNGSLYIVVNKQHYYIKISENLRCKGVWPR